LWIRNFNYAFRNGLKVKKIGRRIGTWQAERRFDQNILDARGD
jgi:hypothetical protein